MPWAWGRKTLAECKQQPRVASEANLSADQSQRKALLPGQEPEPCLCVGGDAHVRRAEQAVLDVERSIPDGDRGLARFRPGEGEMERGVEAARLVRLERIGHGVKQPGDRARPETVAHGLHRFVLE